MGIISIDSDSRDFVLDELGRISGLPWSGEDEDLQIHQGSYGVVRECPHPWRAGAHPANEVRHGRALKPTFDEYRIDTAITINGIFQPDINPRLNFPWRPEKIRYRLMEKLNINGCEEWVLERGGWSNIS